MILYTCGHLIRSKILECQLYLRAALTGPLSVLATPGRRCFRFLRIFANVIRSEQDLYTCVSMGASDLMSCLCVHSQEGERASKDK